MNAALLLLVIVSPVVLGLTLEDGPRAYYVANALLVAVLLWDRRNAQDQAWRSVCWQGIAVQLLAAGYGIWTEAGALDAGEILAVLASFCVVAEVVAQLEARKWRRRNLTT